MVFAGRADHKIVEQISQTFFVSSLTFFVLNKVKVFTFFYCTKYLDVDSRSNRFIMTDRHAHSYRSTI